MSDSAHGGRLPAATQAPDNQGQIRISTQAFSALMRVFSTTTWLAMMLGIGLLQAPLP